jgi:hypothetical protein
MRSTSGERRACAVTNPDDGMRLSRSVGMPPAAASSSKDTNGSWTSVEVSNPNNPWAIRVPISANLGISTVFSRKATVCAAPRESLLPGAAEECRADGLLQTDTCESKRSNAGIPCPAASRRRPFAEPAMNQSSRLPLLGSLFDPSQRSGIACWVGRSAGIFSAGGCRAGARARGRPAPRPLRRSVTREAGPASSRVTLRPPTPQAPAGRSSPPREPAYLPPRGRSRSCPGRP